MPEEDATKLVLASPFPERLQRVLVAGVAAITCATAIASELRALQKSQINTTLALFPPTSTLRNARPIASYAEKKLAFGLRPLLAWVVGGGVGLRLPVRAGSRV